MDQLQHKVDIPGLGVGGDILDPDDGGVAAARVEAAGLHGERAAVGVADPFERHLLAGAVVVPPAHDAFGALAEHLEQLELVDAPGTAVPRSLVRVSSSACFLVRCRALASRRHRRHRRRHDLNSRLGEAV